jgi:hypothetical protein
MMAPARAKKTRVNGSRLSIRAFKSANKLSNLNSASAAATTLSDDKHLSYSLPGSPVSKITPSLQPSPALSAKSDYLQSDINPFLLSPLIYHDLVKQADVSGPDFGFKLVSPVANSHKSRQEHKKEIATSLSEELQTRSRLIFGVANEQPEAVGTNETGERSTLAEASSKSDQDIFTGISSVQPITVSPTAALTPTQYRAQVVPTSHLPAKEQFVEPPKSLNPLESTLPRSSPIHLQPYSEHPAYYAPLSNPYQRYYPPMSYSNGYPPGYPYGPPPPRNGSPYQTLHGGFPRPYQLQRHDSIGSKGSNEGDPGLVPLPSTSDNTTAIEDDPRDLVDRISSVIPDIHILINRSKVTYGELGLREQLLRKAEAESMEAVRQREDYISQLNKQLHDIQKRHEKENNKHRFSIANLEDKRKELEEQLKDVQTHERASKERIRELEEQKATLMRDNLRLSQIAGEERGKNIKEIESWKRKANELLAAEQRITTAEQVCQLNVFEDWKSSAWEALDLMNVYSLESFLRF